MSDGDLGPVALLALCPIGIASGLAMLWVLRACSDQAALARARSLIVAHLLQFRLFGDEPALVLRAQRDVAVQSFRLIRLLLPPAAIMAAPMLFLFAQLDAVFGKLALVPGQAGVVTVHWNGAGEAPRLEQSAGIAVESAPVHVASAQQISWRFRPTQAGRSELRFVKGAQVWTKSVAAGWGMGYVSARRVTLGVDFALYSAEPPLPGGDVESIAIGYGVADVCGLHWVVWFLVFSGAAILARDLVRRL